MEKIEPSQLESISGGYCDPRIPGTCVNTCIVQEIFNSLTDPLGLPDLSCI